jgi:hypothetical protein
MFLNEFDTTPKTNLPIVPFKMTVYKNDNDAFRKNLDFWAAKLLWAKFCLRLNGNLHIVKCKICSEMEGKEKILVAKWDSLCKNASQRKVERNIGTNVKKGD